MTAQTHASGATLLDPLPLSDRLAALTRDKGLDSPGRTAAAAAILKDADGRALAAALERLRAGAPGIAIAHAICAARDSVIGAAFGFATNPLSSAAADDLALLAVGGYGRGTLAPHSDIDLLFLVRRRAPKPVLRAVEATLYLLWDIGLKVGHATRTVAECVTLAREDMTIRTSLLETRYIAGGRALFDDLERRYWNEVATGTGADFVAAKLAERDVRHARTGQSRYLVEPNVKDGKGGFRDLHTLFWIAKYVYRARDPSDLVDDGILSPQEFNTFQRASAFLWNVRCHMHAHTGRAEDRLTFDLQPDIARRLGYRDSEGLLGVEAFMKNYFLVAHDVGVLTRIISAALELSQRKPTPGRWRGPGAQERIPGPGFVLRHGRLAQERPGLFREDPASLLRLVHAADAHGLDIHPDTYRQAIDAANAIDGATRAAPEANRLFLEILTSRNDPERGLRWLNELGVLGRFVPDFANAVARMQFNMYHHYTVDEHVIRAIGYLARFEKGELTESFPLADRIARNLRNRRPLYLAALLHDVAKGQPGDHWVLGAEIARRLGPRLGLGPAETNLAAWLVLHHMTMSETAQHRDIYDPRTARDFADIVQSPTRLRLLLLLTVTDMHAVGPGIWTGWKAKLLENLYTETLPLLGGDAPAPAREGRVARVKARLGRALADWSETARDAVLDRLDDAYWLGLDGKTLYANAPLIRDASAALARGETPALAAAAPDKARAAMRVSVVTADRAGLFASLTGAISALNATILDAKVFTAADGLAVDMFWVQGLDPQADAARLEARVCEAARGAGGRTLSLSRPGRRVRAFTVPPEVNVDNSASELFTVIEVLGRDRPGLLHDLSVALRDLRLSIVSAHVSTYGERAVDVFYVKGRSGLKVTSEKQIAEIEQRLTAVFDESAWTV